MKTKLYKKGKKMIKVAIFDLDGTVLSTLSTINYFVCRTLKKYGLDPITEEECCGFAGNGPQKLISRAFAYRKVTDEQTARCALADYIADYDSDPFNLTEPFEGIVEMLEGLKAQGIKTAIVSNKQDSSVKLAAEHFFSGLVDLAVGSREGVPTKPHPDAVLPVLSHFGVTPEECAFIGDSDVDVLSGINIGCALTVAVTWGYRSREVLESAGAANFADTPDDVLKYILKYNR
jgi:phosphoglycolate phosphatase